MGYGAQTAGNSPYGTAFPQGAAAFTPQSSTGLQSGQKRDSAYDQVGIVHCNLYQQAHPVLICIQVAFMLHMYHDQGFGHSDAAFV